MSKRFSIRSLATLVSSGREITWLILYRVVLLISILFGSFSPVAGEEDLHKLYRSFHDSQNCKDLGKDVLPL